MVLDSFWERTDLDPIEARTPVECVSSETSKEDVPFFYHSYMTPFHDHKDGADTMLTPRSILWMRVEKAKVPWIDVRFESKSESLQSFDNGVTRIMFNSETSEMSMRVGIKKTLTLARTTSINRRHKDPEFLI